MYVRIVFFAFLLAAPAATRRVPSKVMIPPHVEILGSPSFEPLSEIALNLTQLHERFPDAELAAKNDLNASHLLNSLKMKMNRMRPALENLLRISVENETDEVEKARQNLDLDTNIEKIKEILSQLHGQLKILDGGDLSKHIGHLSKNVQGAMIHAQVLSSKSSGEKTYHPLIEKVVIKEYIPTAEKIYKINKEIENTHQEQHYDEYPVKKIESLWKSAHNGVVTSASNLLRLISKLRNSMGSSRNPQEEEKLSAVSRFVQEDVAQKLKGMTWKTLLDQLQENEKELLLLSHAEKNDSITKEAFHNITLAKATSLAHQVQAMIPNLKKVDGELHAIQDRVRFMSSRVERSKEQQKEKVVRNNKMRQQINSLRFDLVSAMKIIRSEMSVLLGVQKSTAETTRFDLSSLQSRYSQLEASQEDSELRDRFKNEMRELKSLFTDLQREMEKLENFREVQRQEKKKKHDL